MGAAGCKFRNSCPHHQQSSDDGCQRVRSPTVRERKTRKRMAKECTTSLITSRQSPLATVGLAYDRVSDTRSPLTRDVRFNHVSCIIFGLANLVFLSRRIL